MQEWAHSNGPDADTPQCYGRTYTEMLKAVEREKDRRHAISDARSIGILEQRRAHLHRRPAAPASIRKKVRRGVTGFWPLVPPTSATLFRAFLHGNDLVPLYPEGPGSFSIRQSNGMIDEEGPSLSPVARPAIQLVPVSRFPFPVAPFPLPSPP